MSGPVRGFTVALLALAGCQASTTRPTFQPLPEARTLEVRLPIEQATQILAQALEQDSVPLARVEPRDGYLETSWFSVPGFTPTSHRPLGPAINRLRAWVDPGKPGPPVTSIYTVEVVYRELADPSRPEREGERSVGTDGPAGMKLLEVLRKLAGQYGDSASMAALTPALPPTPAKTDSTKGSAAADTGRRVLRSRPPH